MKRAVTLVSIALPVLGVLTLLWAISFDVVEAVYFVAIFSPGAILAGIGWRLSHKIQNAKTQTLTRAGLISIAFAPALYGHAGFVPAIWVVLLAGEWGMGLAALIALLLAWGIAVPLLLYLGRLPGHWGTPLAVIIAIVLDWVITISFLFYLGRFLNR